MSELLDRAIRAVEDFESKMKVDFPQTVALREEIKRLKEKVEQIESGKEVLRQHWRDQIEINQELRAAIQRIESRNKQRKLDNATKGHRIRELVAETKGLNATIERSEDEYLVRLQAKNKEIEQLKGTCDNCEHWDYTQAQCSHPNNSFQLGCNGKKCVDWKKKEAMDVRCANCVDCYTVDPVPNPCKSCLGSSFDREYEYKHFRPKKKE